MATVGARLRLLEEHIPDARESPAAPGVDWFVPDDGTSGIAHNRPVRAPVSVDSSGSPFMVATASPFARPCRSDVKDCYLVPDQPDLMPYRPPTTTVVGICSPIASARSWSPVTRGVIDSPRPARFPRGDVLEVSARRGAARPTCPSLLPRQRRRHRSPPCWRRPALAGPSAFVPLSVAPDHPTVWLTRNRERLDRSGTAHLLVIGAERDSHTSAAVAATRGRRCGRVVLRDCSPNTESCRGSGGGDERRSASRLRPAARDATRTPHG